jgi:hypothetical protein
MKFKSLSYLVVIFALTGCGGGGDAGSNANTDSSSNGGTNADGDVSETVDSRPYPVTVACAPSTDICGVWKKEFSANQYLEITNTVGANYMYFELEGNTCWRDPHLSAVNEQAVNVRYWADFNELDGTDESKLFTSTVTTDTEDDVTTLTDTYLLWGELDTDNYNRSTLPAPCLALPDASPIVDLAQKDSEVIGSWIGSKLPYATAPESGNAFIFRADGSVTIFNGFESGQASCTDSELEYYWSMDEDGKMKISSSEDLLFSDEFHIFRTANGSIVMANGPDAANELTKTDKSESELRATCEDS